jgi:uncharacterized Zn finger protein (UPF0148 family)
MTKKPIFDKDITCPWCGKPAHVKIEKETIVPAEPAETEIKVTVERGKQEVLA